MFAYTFKLCHSTYSKWVKPNMNRLTMLTFVLSKVLTTIETTAYSVEQLMFPTVTFCSPGFNDAILQAAILKQFFAFLRDRHGIDVNVAPITCANVLLKVTIPVYLSQYLSFSPSPTPTLFLSIYIC